MDNRNGAEFATTVEELSLEEMTGQQGDGWLNGLSVAIFNAASDNDP
ncbi:MAG: hypothetical protein PVH64_10260 [Bacillota bacterium]|jgi:hypothetical protein